VVLKLEETSRIGRNLLLTEQKTEVLGENPLSMPLFCNTAQKN
jgi:hypothetical protein